MRRLLVAVPGAMILALLAGCGAGGFGGDAPESEVRKPITKYVALGDGFAAGPFLGTTDRTNGCLRSADNYPHQVAQRLGVPVTDVTCTGATTTSIEKAGKAPVGTATLPAQLDAVTPDTDLVTLTVGIQDEQMLQRGFFVCMAFPCGNRIPPQDLAADAEAAGDAITAIVRTIQQKAPNAQVILVSYPQLVPESNPCSALPDLDNNQLIGVAALFFSLNRELQSAALSTGSNYVDLYKITSGHNICGEDPWVRGIGNKPSPRTILHPLAPAQRAAADAVVEAVRSR